VSVHIRSLYVSVFAAMAITAVLLPLASGKDEGDVAVEYSAERLRDPFKSYIVKENKTAEAPPREAESDVLKPLPVFTVQGVFWGGRFPQAIIDNKIVKEGDVIQDAKVINISRDSIRFMFANREFSVSPASTALSQDMLNPTGSRKEVP
jgi:hypothetical protein